jgi:CheY-like chemotaxis protein
VNIPIIALTALAMAGDRCLEAGANDYLSKPIKLKQVATIIQQIFEFNKFL